MSAQWRTTLGDRRSKSPFHDVDIPLLKIPGMDATSILPDSCHCFHLGWGIDLAASGLVLAARKDLFGNHRNFNAKLQEAYRLFTGWCHQNGKTTGVNCWSLKKLDMASYLKCIHEVFFLWLATNQHI